MHTTDVAKKELAKKLKDKIERTIKFYDFEFYDTSSYYENMIYAIDQFENGDPEYGIKDGFDIVFRKEKKPQHEIKWSLTYLIGELVTIRDQDKLEALEEKPPLEKVYQVTLELESRNISIHEGTGFERDVLILANLLDSSINYIYDGSGDEREENAIGIFVNCKESKLQDTISSLLNYKR